MFFDIIGILSIIMTLSVLINAIGSKVIFNIYGLLARGVRFILITNYVYLFV